MYQDNNYLLTNVIGHAYHEYMRQFYNLKGLIINYYKYMKRDEPYLIARHLPKDFSNEPAGGVGG